MGDWGGGDNEGGYLIKVVFARVFTESAMTTVEAGRVARLLMDERMYG